MDAKSLLFCRNCNRTTAHVRQASYDHWGSLSKQVERCVVCLAVEDGHEAPAADPPPVTACLSDTEIARCLYQRHLIATGSLNEGPGEAWDATPGVWG